ncbi:hypothetical protein CRUP_004803 [Coryphaenoides rupestris]|nr:hypothetical protein CRUP_004803 [Coryphaenoides rupestris]
MLTVLQTVFSKPLEREEIFTSTELATIFPSLDEIIEMHYTFHENLKKLRREDGFIVKNIGATLLNRFGGPEGEWFQKLTARFCSHQSWALEQIKSRQKKEPRCNAFIQEAESKPQCRRLQLKDIIPIEMQRLTKYPLLLENIAKSTEDHVEKENIQQSAECCRKILNHVNDEVKVMENLLNLKDYQRRLDTSGLKPSTDLYTEYKNIDLTQKMMIYEGPLTWKVTKEKAIEVQCVLLGDLLVLLQHRKAFYVIFTWDSGAQIYELVAQSSGERKTWTEVIKTAVDDLKQSVRDKDSLTEDKPTNAPHTLIDYLSDKGFDLIGHSNSDQEKLANSALDEVMSLKRLLVGSISLSEDSLPDEENGKEDGGSERMEDDPGGCQSPGGAESGGAKGEEEEEQDEEGGGGISAPLVLSQERMKEVYSRLQHLEESLRRLQAVEEDHHKLQEALSKFSLEGGNFQ